MLPFIVSEEAEICEAGATICHITVRCSHDSHYSHHQSLQDVMVDNHLVKIVSGF